MPHAPLVALLLLLLATRAAPLLPGALLRATNTSCRTRSDCRPQGSWCARGLLCLGGRCHALPDFPCASAEWCDDRERRCRRRECASWRDCDDGVFCNGVEICAQGFCVTQAGTDCTQGLCDERTQRCSRPRALVDVADVPTEAPTSAPTNASNSTVPVGSITNQALAWIIGSIGALLFILVFFTAAVQASRRVMPTILVDRDAARGASRVYVPQVNY